MGNEKAARRLTGVVCQPGDPKPKVVSGEGDSLEVMQALVGGYIEKVGSYPYMGHLVIDVFVDEDGLAKNLSPNRSITMPPTRGMVQLLGPVVMMGADTATGETISLDSFEGMLDFALRIARSWHVST